jgi:hypothetical protein
VVSRSWEGGTVERREKELKENVKEAKGGAAHGDCKFLEWESLTGTSSSYLIRFPECPEAGVAREDVVLDRLSVT